MKHHFITGGGNTRLHLVETGNASGRPILFIHGFSQSCLSWTRQLNSDLGDDFRLLAMDIRGHGRSDKPRDAYGDPHLWADDVRAVIESLGLDRPILVGWSYGPLIILDYIRHYGEDALGGINFIGGVTKLGSDEAAAVLMPEFLALIPGFFSTDAEARVKSLESLLRLCIAPGPPDDDLYLMLGSSVVTPPYVRQAMFARAFDNDDLLPNVRIPVLISHGTADRVVKLLAAEQIKASVPHAELHVIENAEHAVFWDQSRVYNDSLRAWAGDAISRRAAEASQNKIKRTA